jgi:hypothetical protein
MRSARILLPLLLCSLAVAVCAILGSGCASRNVDPASARSHTGYIDFFATNDDELCWDITEVKHDREIVREFKPLPEHILRLAFRPGEYEFRVSFLNRVITDPAVTNVVVHDGMITPVSVTLIEAGTAQVETKETHVGGTWYGRYGRGTKFRDNEAGIFRLDAEPQNPLPYKPKAEMPYANMRGN